jgi:hypothetical protein
LVSADAGSPRKAAGRGEVEDFIAVELFCALLTGFFLWLLIYHWRWKSIGRMRRLAGDLVFTTKTAHSRRWLWVLLAFVLVYPLCFVASTLSAAHIPVATQFVVAAWFAGVLLLGVPLISNTALEIRERGVVCGKHGNGLSIGKAILVPWSQIDNCRWVAGTFVGVPKGDNAHKRLALALDAISVEQKDALIAAVAQFVPVHAYDGALLAKPDDEFRKAVSISWRELDGPRFQFDLQTLFLLAVVVACIANLFALRYRSPEFQAVMKLEAFSPKIEYWGQDHVHQLDFSLCANKPTDADLVYLEPLTELALLDLSGAPITDAGLKHLKGLKQLSIVELANTGVTDAGMEDLRRALPNASIAKRVHWIPPGVVPLAPSPPKGKRRR